MRQAHAEADLPAAHASVLDRAWPEPEPARESDAAPALPADRYAGLVARVAAMWARGRGGWITAPELEPLLRCLDLSAPAPEETPFVYFGSGRVGGAEDAAIRVLEIAVAALALALLGPLWLVIALLVRLDGGPALHRSLRAGRDGVPFRLLKFRSMSADDRRDAERRRFRGAIIQGVFPGYIDTHGRRVTKNPRDERITWIGRILRSTSLDEVPQFLHVLSGTMALVGPRPYVLDEVACFKPWHHLRQVGKPGLTGLWQVSGRSTVGFDESVMLDIYYLANRSFWLDLWIVLRTPVTMFRARGAY